MFIARYKHIVPLRRIRSPRRFRCDNDCFVVYRDADPRCERFPDEIKHDGLLRR